MSSLGLVIAIAGALLVWWALGAGSLNLATGKPTSGATGPTA